MATIDQPLPDDGSLISADTEASSLNSLLARAYVINWEMVFYVAIFGLALFTRFFELGVRIMSHDESLHTQYSYYLYNSGDFEHQPLMHGPILFHFTAFFFFLFGDNDFSGRIYAAIMGVLIVMAPILFRRWLGRYGAMIASGLLLISPLMMYYSRYIRHDMPSILSALVMAWAILMYLNGPENQRRRAYWLYILAGAMLWNLGSKETAFIYIALFGAFLTLYWLVRLAQYFYGVPGKPVFQTVMMGVLLAGVGALLMIIVVSITLADSTMRDYFELQFDAPVTLSTRLDYIGEQIGNLVSLDPVTTAFATFLTWTGLVIAFIVALTLGPALWAYRRREDDVNVTDVLAVMGVLVAFWVVTLLDSMALGLLVAIIIGLAYAWTRLRGSRSFARTIVAVLGIAVIACAIFLVIEELSHSPSRGDETAQPADPNDPNSPMIVVGEEFTWLPVIAGWIVAAVVLGGLMYSRRAGWWDKHLNKFPELDVLIIMGSLVLPWLTAFLIVATNPAAEAYRDIALALPEFLRDLIPTSNSAIGAEQQIQSVGRVTLGFLAWVPMMAVAIATGLTWNWRRWLVASLIFHTLFAFFFTTIFTNIQGLATGMIYSLEYWLEQQGERRGSQPQYYYTLIIMPIYEFLPVIGAVLATVAGSVMFWRKRRERDEYLGIMALEAEIDAELGEDAAEVENSLDPPPPSAALTTGDYEAVIPDTAQPRPDPRWTLTQVPFLLFVSWWGVMNLLAYTLAGEKMPWLGTHLTVPLILLTAWYLGGIAERFDARAFFARRGWIYLVVLPLLLISFFQVVAPYFDGNPPFQGVAKSQLKTTYEWLAVVALSAGLVYGVFRLAERTGWHHVRHMFAIAVFGILGVITLGSAWRASFIKYDEATEFLVYAHAGPGNRIVVDKLRELSLLTTGSMDIVFAHDDGMHWPGLWYFREFPNSIAYNSNPTFRDVENAVAIAVRGDGLNEVEPLLEGQFVRWDYVRMWWPMQDYYDLTATRVNNLLDIGSSDSPAAATRRGIWDIWWSRDFDQYARAVNRVADFELTNWPLHDRVYFFVRRDVAARVWQYGVGGGSVLTEGETQTSACLTNWQPLEASLVFDTVSAGISRPIDMAIGPDGLLYVTEEGNHRISIFDLNGNFVGTFGQQGTALQEGPFFERPNGLAFSPDGRLVVADTWNSLIRVFSPDNEYITGWGQAMAVGAGAPREPVDGYWGPRDVAVDAEGRIYVADTGNKRIRVYAADGTFLRDIGSAGSGEGQLDEPAGLFIHPDGRLFVADTWNRRVSVFSLDGVPMYNFRVDGWRGDEQGNLNFRPYLAADTVRDMLYVPDMDAGRVLVYDTAGNCLGAFGQFAVENPGPSQFAGIGGITVDDNGFVYVSDIVTGRILRFNPFPRPEAIPGEADASQDAGNVVLDVPEMTAETSPEVTEDSMPQETPETTAETSPEAGPQATEEPAE